MAALVLAIPACDSRTLTEDQATAILEAMAELATMDDDDACPLGGAAPVEHRDTVREAGETTWSSASWVVTPTNCKLLISGEELTTNGNPGITFAVDDEVIGDSWPRVEFRITGALTWRRGNESSGSCSVDLGIDSIEVDAHGSGRPYGDVVGSLCGRDMVIELGDFYDQTVRRR